MSVYGLHYPNLLDPDEQTNHSIQHTYMPMILLEHKTENLKLLLETLEQLSGSKKVFFINWHLMFFLPGILCFGDVQAVEHYTLISLVALL